MKRRDALQAFLGLGVGFMLDPERLLWRQGAKVFSFAPASFVPLRSELIQATRSELTVVPGLGPGAAWGVKHTMCASGWRYKLPRIL